MGTLSAIIACMSMYAGHVKADGLCAVPAPVVLTGGPEKYKLKKQLQRAIDFWNEQAGTKVLYSVIVPREHYPITVRFATPKELRRWRRKWQGYSKYHLGPCYPSGTLILIRPDNPRANSIYYYNILRHELGHMLGLRHNGSMNGLMAYQHPRGVIYEKELNLLPRQFVKLNIIYGGNHEFRGRR